MKLTLSILVSVFACTLFADRDPFWPIDHVPSGQNPPPEIDKPEEPKPGLSPEELKAKTERQIKEALNRKATVVKNGKVSALVNGKLVSQGDTLTVKSEGQTFRLKVKILTADNIVLEPIQ